MARFYDATVRKCGQITAEEATLLILLIFFSFGFNVHLNWAYREKKNMKTFPFSFHVISISAFHYLLIPNLHLDPHPLCSYHFFPFFYSFPLSLFHQPIISQSKTISTPPDISLTVNEVVE